MKENKIKFYRVECELTNWNQRFVNDEGKIMHFLRQCIANRFITNLIANITSAYLEYFAERKCIFAFYRLMKTKTLRLSTLSTCLD